MADADVQVIENDAEFNEVVNLFQEAIVVQAVKWSDPLLEIDHVAVKAYGNSWIHIRVYPNDAPEEN